MTLFATIVTNLTLLLGATSAFAATSDLTVQISGLHAADGQVLISLYNGPDGFPSDGRKAVRTAKVSVHGGSVIAHFDALETGDYAFAFFHDENGNSKLDTNSFGVPTEGFGFSNDPTISFGPPPFDEARFRVSAPKTQVKATTRYF